MTPARDDLDVTSMHSDSRYYNNAPGEYEEGDTYMSEHVQVPDENTTVLEGRK